MCPFRKAFVYHFIIETYQCQFPCLIISSYIYRGSQLSSSAGKENVLNLHTLSENHIDSKVVKITKTVPVSLTHVGFKISK